MERKDIEAMIEIVNATTPDHIEDARRLFREYAASLPFSLDFQDFDAELATLPGEYAPPWGALLIARSKSAAGGCVALRRMDAHCCEMKRLYVREAFRGRGVGTALVQAVIAQAKARHFERMRLDTTPTMKEAQALYRAYGFVEIEPYRHNPIPGTIFMELRLRA